MNYTSPTLAYYLNNIKNFPVLNRTEERQLAKKARKGNEEAKQKLILSNLKFVVIVAKKYLNSGIPLIDLISEGNLGLIKAIDSFDERKGFHFISYAVHWIKQSIIKAIAEKSKIVRLPLSWNSDLYHLNKSKSLPMKGDSVSALSKELGFKEEKIKDLLRISKGHLSLESQVNLKGESSNVSLIDYLKDDKLVNPEASLMNKSIKNDILKSLECLTDIERKVIIDRFALVEGSEYKKLLEIGKELNLTKERIRQIEKKAFEKLQERIKELEINQYLVS